MDDSPIVSVKQRKKSQSRKRKRTVEMDDDDSSVSNTTTITTQLHSSSSAASDSKNANSSSNNSRDPSTSLKSFLLEQIAYATKSQNLDYYTMTLRKALRNLGDEVIYDPQEALKVKGVGKKTVDKFVNWLQSKGVKVEQKNARSSTTTTTTSTSASSSSSNTRKRRKYSPKEGSIPSAILSIVKSFFIKRNSYPSKHQVVTLVRERHSQKKRTTIMTSIRNLAVQQGVVIEINGAVELTEEGWDVVGGKPSHLQPRQGRVAKKKEELPVPNVEPAGVEVNSSQDLRVVAVDMPQQDKSHHRTTTTTLSSSVADSDNTQQLGGAQDSTERNHTTISSRSTPPTNTTTTNTDPSDPSSVQYSYPIRMTYLGASEQVVATRAEASVKISDHALMYSISVIFPVAREKEVRKRISIDNSHEIKIKNGIGMLLGWISDEDKRSKLQSHELASSFFPLKAKRRRPKSLQTTATPTPKRRRVEEDEEIQLLSTAAIPSPPAAPSSSSSSSPSMTLMQEELNTFSINNSATEQPPSRTDSSSDLSNHTSQPTTQPDAHTITFSTQHDLSADAFSKRNQLVKLADVKPKLAQIAYNNEPRSSNQHTSVSNRITYHGREYDVILLVDNRERLGHDRNAFLTQVKRTIAAESFGLSLGDFLWVAKPVGGNIYASYVLDLVVERKIADDLASSIRDGRKKNQNFRMQRCGISRIYYLVEGRLSSRSRFSSSALTQSMTNMAIRDRFTVIQTSSDADTMDFLWNMTTSLIEQLQNDQLSKYILRDQETEKRLNLLQFNEIGGKDKHLSYPEILGRQLYCLKGCSRDAALAIVGQYPNFFKLREAFLQADREDNGRGKKPAGETFIHKNIGIGARGHLPAEKINKGLSKQVYELMTARSYEDQDKVKK